MLASLSDRLLARVVPKAQATAGFCYTERTSHDGRVVRRTCCISSTFSCGNWSAC
ncbi:hypothetical protein [Nocardiopsis sp. LOL_012]|uniref:hypothetical protein n=1 Tax=Nocardiopsis sp. LOL_012 TaxID=3345409 RepID=UPI003A8A6D06